MITAQEMRLMASATEPIMEAMRRSLEASMCDAITYGTSFQWCREVCARRARKLRKRGELVSFVRSTTNGKSRYTWMKRLAPLDLMLPNHNGR